MPAPQSCLIVGRFLSSVVDSPEYPDRDPDIVPIAGAKVTLTASVARVRASSAEPPATIFMHPIECITDETGQLVGLDGALGVRVIATDDETLNPTSWTWTAVIHAPGLGKISSTFSAPGGGTVDLTTVIPVPSSPGTELKAWTAAVATTTAARDEAVEAVEAVEAAAQAVEAAQTAAAASQASAAQSATNAASSATNAAGSADAAAASAEAAEDAHQQAEALVGEANLDAAVADYLTANPPSGSTDATTLTKGIVKLAGDLGGTADAPTVPGLAGKEPARGPDDNYVTDAEKAALHTHPAVIAQGATAAAARAAIGAGTSSFSGAYADLTGKPTIPDTEAIQDVVGAMVAGAGGRTLLATQTATGTAVTFSDIPQTYAAIRVEWSATNAFGGGKARSLTVNGDTGANYATSGNSGRQTSIPVLAPRAGSEAGDPAGGQSAWIEIMGYATAKNQILSGQSVGNINWANANIALALIGGVWLGGAAVTSLTFTPSASDVCTYRLYGLD